LLRLFPSTHPPCTTCTSSDTVHKCVGPIVPMYSYHIMLVFSLSPHDAQTEKIPVLYQVISLAPFGTAYGIAGSFPYTCHERQATLLELGLFGSGAAYDYRWLSVTCKRAWTDSGHHHSSCYPLDRDNHSCPSPGYRCLLPSFPSVLHLPIFTRRGSVAVDYSNGTEKSWYLSAWVTCQTLVSRAVVDGSLEVGTVGMRKGDRELPRS
jgi:hypothetical protein